MVEKAPIVSPREIADVLTKKGHYAPLLPIVEKVNGEYEPWKSVKYKKLPAGFTAFDLWKCVQAFRLTNRKQVWPRYGVSLSVTPTMQKLCHHFDMNFGGSWGNDALLSDENKTKYLISSLMEEAISSSQMEGAVTTRKVAKEMLRNKKSPKDKSQQMILNNYNTILYIAEHRKEPLSEELLLKIHALMTDKAMDNRDDAGRFRQNNDIVVGNTITGETVHTPPSYTEIPRFVNELCDFFNDANTEQFIHPILRGIIIHFMLAFVHPFVDGNGRTARALFYWYMLKQGYWLTEYLSISRIIAARKIAYEKAFLYVETDEMDLGYFAIYHLKVLNEAFEELKAYIKRKTAEQKAAKKFLVSGLLNLRQAEMIQLYCENPNAVHTVKDFQIKFLVSPTTAKADIVGLLEKGILKEIAFNKVKKGYIKGDKFDEFTK